MAIGCEGDTGLIVNDMCDGDGQRLVGTIADIFFLLVLTRGGTVEALLLRRTQLFHFVVGQNQLIVLFALCFQAEELFDVGQNVFK